MKRRLYYKTPQQLADVYDSTTGVERTPDDEYNLIGSRTNTMIERHLPVLDLDIPHKYVESSTYGHGHLYLDVSLTWQEYKALLKVLRDLRIIEEGFYKVSIARGMTQVRKPGFGKGDK